MGKKTGNPSVVSDERKVRAACDRFLEKLGDACTEAAEKTFGILGSGLGLAIVKKVASLYDGGVFLSSVPDQGSAFTVRLHSMKMDLAEGNQ